MSAHKHLKDALGALRDATELALTAADLGVDECEIEKALASLQEAQAVFNVAVVELAANNNREQQLLKLQDKPIPCPRCNVRPDVFRAFGTSDTWVAQCPGCDVSVKTDLTRECTISRWNSRIGDGGAE